MKLLARWGMLLLIFAVALVFFGSVLCPPLEERTAKESGDEVQYPLQEDPGTYKPLPGDLQIEDRFPQRDLIAPQRDGSSPPEQATYSRIEVLALEEQGQPLEGVFARLMTAQGGSAVIRAEGLTDREGRYRSPQMFAEEVVVELSHQHYFTVQGGPFEMPTQEPVLFEGRMQPAGFVVGMVLGPDAKARTYGWLHLENQSEGNAMVLPIEGGAFRSPPLATGHWRLRWKPHPTAEQDPALSYAFPLEPKQDRHFTVTVPAGKGEPEVENPAAVGIVERPQ